MARLLIAKKQFRLPDKEVISLVFGPLALHLAGDGCTSLSNVYLSEKCMKLEFSDQNSSYS